MENKKKKKKKTQDFLKKKKKHKKYFARKSNAWSKSRQIHLSYRKNNRNRSAITW